MFYSKEQIDRANAVSLEDFLRSQGETLKRCGKDMEWKAHDSLKVRDNKWHRFSNDTGGYPIDFVMEFYGKSFPEAVEMLIGEKGEGQLEAVPAPSPEFHLPLRNVTNVNAKNYLVTERGLDESLTSKSEIVTIAEAQSGVLLSATVFHAYLRERKSVCVYVCACTQTLIKKIK